VLEAFEAVQRGFGLHRDELDRGIQLTQPPADADERAARAEASDEMRDAARRLLPDFERRRIVVRAPVELVVVLIRVVVAVRIR